MTLPSPTGNWFGIVLFLLIAITRASVAAAEEVVLGWRKRSANASIKLA
jgi:hypothetical protein